ncbi:thiamine pyrophosphate-binding protein [Streptomyces profundus]|uniref:thiamine pyrophosphate-binding protein n=1 Tax=Streptomyces profundus TaxID=2867410 RepID=UPI002240F66D|nr:thiamine pyrophosphate-binding protein [Streptomyces sp. MA3_2.13]UED83250.1 hypothetical protein K4G22_02760 [Streptomyces sp. MA3_2.13]
MDGARALLRTLSEAGVRQVFCCPGTTEIPLLDALADPEVAAWAPEFVLTTHEAISVSMADGHARATGRPAVAYLHTNVGLANGLSHLYAAQLAHSPVVVFTGVKPTATLPHRALTTTPQLRESARPYVGFDWQTLRPDALVADAHRALWHASVPPERPTLLVVPQDMLAAEVGEPAVAPAAEPARQAPDPAGVAAAARALAAARRPVIVAGPDVGRRHAAGELAAVAELLGAPVLAPSRRDLERFSYPTTGGHYAGLLDVAELPARAADVVLLAGAPNPIEFAPGAPLLPPRAALVHLAEDPAEPGLRLPTARVLAGDTAIGLRALREALAGVERPHRAEALAFLAEARAHHAAARRRWATEVAAADSDGPPSAADAMRTLAAAVPDSVTLVVDAVTSTLPLLRFVERERLDGLYATASGSLGWGMGAALGVAMAQPERRVLAVVGDGVLQFGLPALWTAVRRRLPVTFVVVNNGRYQAMISGLRRFDGVAHAGRRYPLTDISGPRLAEIAAGFGMPASRVADRDALATALDAAVRRGPEAGPELIEIRVDQTLWP